jgi:hypothetical protein
MRPKDFNRDVRARAAKGPADGAFLFPQTSLGEQAKRGWLKIAGALNLSIAVLAFNISTASSAADSSVLSRWANH